MHSRAAWNGICGLVIHACRSGQYVSTIYDRAPHGCIRTVATAWRIALLIVMILPFQKIVARYGAA